MSTTTTITTAISSTLLLLLFTSLLLSPPSPAQALQQTQDLGLDCLSDCFQYGVSLFCPCDDVMAGAGEGSYLSASSAFLSKRGNPFPFRYGKRGSGLKRQMPFRYGKRSVDNKRHFRAHHNLPSTAEEQ